MSRYALVAQKRRQSFRKRRAPDMRLRAYTRLHCVDVQKESSAFVAYSFQF